MSNILKEEEIINFKTQTKKHLKMVDRNWLKQVQGTSRHAHFAFDFDDFEISSHRKQSARLGHQNIEILSKSIKKINK